MTLGGVPRRSGGPPLGVYSTATVGSEQPIGIQVNHDSIVEVIARRGRLELFVEQPQGSSSLAFRNPPGRPSLLFTSYMPDLHVMCAGVSSNGVIADPRAAYITAVSLAYKACRALERAAKEQPRAAGGSTAGTAKSTTLPSTPGSVVAADAVALISDLKDGLLVPLAG